MKQLILSLFILVSTNIYAKELKWDENLNQRDTSWSLPSPKNGKLGFKLSEIQLIDGQLGQDMWEYQQSTKESVKSKSRTIIYLGSK